MHLDDVQGFHRPIYTTSLEGVTLASDLVVASDLRDAFEQIFYQYEVCDCCKTSHYSPAIVVPSVMLRASNSDPGMRACSTTA